MSVPYDDTNFDFDLDFLNTGSVKSVVSDPEKVERSRKAILITKKKIVATDSLIRRYYDKRDEVEQFERSLQTSKEECKQICLDYKSISEKYNILEKEAVSLRLKNAELHELYSKSESVNGAIKSHANQLQVLVKEKETTIESLKIENQLLKANFKNNEKNVLSLEKVNADLMKDICLLRQVIIGKRKLNKNCRSILQKYENSYVSGDEDSVLEDDSDTDIENEAQKVAKGTQINSIKGASVPSKIDHEHDSDCSNELASADTGRGSSLASSDGEKCFNSPDYFLHHSPIDLDPNHKEKRLYIDTGTSPIIFDENPSQSSECETIKIVLSPMEDEPELEPNLTHDDKESDLQPSLSNVGDTDNNHDRDIDSEALSSVNPELEPSLASNVDTQNISSGNHNGELNTKALINLEPENQPIWTNNAETDNILPVDNHDDEIEQIVVITAEQELESILTSNANTNNISLSPVDSLDDEADPIVVITVEPDPEGSLANDVENNNILSVNNHDGENKRSLESIFEPECQTSLNNNSSTDNILSTNNLLCNINTAVLCDSSGLTTKLVTDKISIENNDIELNPSVFVKSATNDTSVEPKETTKDSIDHDSSKNISPLRSSIISNRESNNEKECLELNNSDNLNQTNTHSDCEIEMILNRMRLNHTLITPIPSTPSKSHRTSDSRDRVSKVSRGKEHVCKDAAKVKEDSRLLHEKYAKLEQEIQFIKGILQNKFAITDLHNISEHKSDSSRIVSEKIITNIESLSPITKQNKTRMEQIESSKTDTTDVTPQSEKCLLSSNSISSPKELEKPLSLSSDHHEHFIINMENIDRTKTPIETIGQTKVNDEPDSISTNKHRKLSKLEKLRKNLIPKSKIKRKLISPTKRKSIKSKQLLTPKKTVVESDSAATLNNKDVYKKAVQIMSELKSQSKTVKTQEHVRAKVMETSTISEEHKISEIIENKDQREKIKSNLIKKELVVAIVKCNSQIVTSPSPKKQIETRSRSRFSDEVGSKDKHITNGNILESYQQKNTTTTNTLKIVNNEREQCSRKRQKRESFENYDVPCKRILRSSHLSPCDQSRNGNVTHNVRNNTSEISKKSENINTSSASNNLLNYSDMDIFNNDSHQHTEQTIKEVKEVKVKRFNPKEIIFCSMLDKYGKQARKNCTKKLPESIITSTSKTIQDEINIIIHLDSNEAKNAMNKLVNIIQAWDHKRFIAALMSYLKDSQRKLELFNKIPSPPAPPMTKSEQILLYVISQLLDCWSTIDILNYILCNIEYELFKLNRTPDFDTIESMSHFYAVLCRYFKMKSRLRLFMLDAMYCIQFKAVPLIKQCLDVWMHVLPLAHMGIAKSPLVTCLVYLLHFYKCEDRFNRVQEIRNILHRKYFYEITEWNEPKIMDMFKNAIIDLRAIPIESKMLRIALIVISKRHGPKWCQNNIVKNVLLPTLEKNVPDRVKLFCISLLGPLLKPYPVDMKVHCEIVMNLLLDKLKLNPTPQMQEAIVTSLIYMSKHNQVKVLQTLLTWNPQPVSLEMKKTLQDFVAEKPLKVWRTVLAKVQLAP